MLQVSRTLAQQQQVQQAYGSPLKVNLSDGRCLVPPSTRSWVGFWLGETLSVNEWHLLLWASCAGKVGVLFTSNANSLSSLQEPPPSSYSSIEHSLKKRDLDTLIVSALSGLFSVSHLLRADLSLALLGPSDPSLAGHLDQCQTANWNVTLPSCRRSSLQDQPHQQAAPGGRCHRGYSHTISHSDLTHPSALSVIPGVSVAKGQDSLGEWRTQAKQTERRSDQLREHTPAAERVGNFRAVTPAVVSSSRAFLLPHLSTQEKDNIHSKERNHLQVQVQDHILPFSKRVNKMKKPTW